MPYVYSTSEELFSSDEYETKEEALAAAIEEQELDPGEGIFIGEKHEPDPRKYMPDADEILDSMSEQAYEDAGEAAENWPDVTDEDRAKLTEMVQDAVLRWMKETGNEPNFFLVKNIETMQAPIVQAPEADGRGA